MVMALACVTLVGAGFGVGEKYIPAIVAWALTLAGPSKCKMLVAVEQQEVCCSIGGKQTGWSQMGPGLFTG